MGGVSETSPAAPTPEPRTSQGLGFYQGAIKAPDNIASGVEKVLSAPAPDGPFHVPSAGNLIAKGLNYVGDKLGLPSAAQAKQSHADYIAAQAKKGVVPGALGNFAGEVAGTLPLMAMAPGALAGGALAGASLSDAETPMGVIGDAALGAAGGKLGELAVTGASRLAKPVFRAAGRKIVEYSTPAADRGTQYVANLISASGRSPTEIASTLSAGKPFTVAEAIGRPGITGLASLGRRSGQTPDALEGALTARAAGMPSRVMGDFAETLGVSPAAAKGDIDAVVKAAQSKATPLYEEAYKANTNIASPEIDRVLSTPAGKAALRKARDLMQNDMTLLGARDPELLAQVRESGQALPWKGGVASGLKLRTYDYVKRALDDQISAAFRGGNKSEGAILSGLKSRLVKALDNADVTGRAGPNSLKPEGGAYARARKSAGDYLRVQEQFQNGQTVIFNHNVSARDLAADVSKLGDAEIDALKGGVANRIFSIAQSGRLRPGMLSVPVVRDKLTALFGRDKAVSFISRVEQEANMARAGARMMPGAGSATSELEQAAIEQNDQRVLDVARSAIGAGHHLVGGNPLGAISRGMDAVRAHVGAGGRMPVEARDQAGRLLMMSPQDFSRSGNHDIKRVIDRSLLADQRATYAAQLLSRAKTPVKIAGPAALLEAQSQGR